MLFLSLCSEHNGSFVCEWILVTTFFYVNKKVLNNQLAKKVGDNALLEKNIRGIPFAFLSPTINMDFLVL